MVLFTIWVPSGRSDICVFNYHILFCLMATYVVGHCGPCWYLLKTSTNLGEFRSQYTTCMASWYALATELLEDMDCSSAFTTMRRPCFPYGLHRIFVPAAHKVSLQTISDCYCQMANKGPPPLPYKTALHDLFLLCSCRKSGELVNNRHRAHMNSAALHLLPTG